MLRTLIIGIIVGIMTLPVFARVIEVEGSARIVGGDTQAARDQAIENALQQALMMTGSTIRSNQLVVIGVIQNQETELAAGELERVEVLREETRDGRVFVLVQTEIWSNQDSCAGQRYKPVSLLPHSNFRIVNMLRTDRCGTWVKWRLSILQDIARQSEQLFVTHTLKRHPDFRQHWMDLT